MGYSYESWPRSYEAELRTPHVRSRASVSYEEYRPPETLKRRAQERVVEESRASYEQIQQLIGQYSNKFGVKVKKTPQLESGVARSSPRPSFLVESTFLAERIEGLNVPKTMSYGKYEGNPGRQPIVMKNERVARGDQKYLIETREQLHQFQKWMGRYGDRDNWVAQEYIKTPGDAPASIRILADCTGEVIASQMYYGPPYRSGIKKAMATEEDTTKDPSKHLEYPESPMFLGARMIASNHMLLRDDDSTIGGRISLNPLPISHPYSTIERELLEAHGLDRENPILPKELTRVASEIGLTLGVKEQRVHELVLGIDFVKNEKTGQFVLLEVNRRPSMAAVRDMLGRADSIGELDAWRWVISGSLQRAAGILK